MTIEDLVRRVLQDAVATEPPPRGAPLQVAIRRRRRRPVLAGAVAVVLVLAAVAGLAAVRSGRRPLPTTVPTEGGRPPPTPPRTCASATRPAGGWRWIGRRRSGRSGSSLPSWPGSGGNLPTSRNGSGSRSG